MRRVLLIFMVMILSVCVYSYERSGINFQNPSVIDGGGFTYTIKHRFMGNFTNDVIDTFFFINTGVSMYLEVSYFPITGLKVNFGYENAFSGYHLGISYGQVFPFVKLSGSLEYLYTKENIANNYGRYHDFFGVISLQTDPIFDVIDIGLNIGYDYLYNSVGIGVFTTIGYFKLPNGYKISLVGEYYPTISKLNGDFDNFVFGIKLDTYGHHFIISVGNTYFSTTRSSMFGMSDNYLRLGFRIDRLMQL